MNLKNNTTFKDFYNITAWTLKKTLSTSIAYWILLFVSLPLIQIMISFDVPYGAETFVTSAKECAGSFFSIIAIAFSTIFTFISLNYMHGKRVTDFFGSLPVTRTTMFYARIFSAAISSIVPMIITILISTFLALDSAIVRPLFSVMTTLTIAILFNISFTSVICLCCGTTVDAIIKYFLINGIIPVAVLLINYFPACCLPGMANTFISIKQIQFFSTIASPIIAPFIAMFVSGKWWFYIIWTVATIALIVFGRQIVLRRKSETAQSSVAFPWPDRVINFISNFTFGLIVGLIFALMFRDRAQHFWFLFGCLLGSFVPHFLLHIIRNRSLENFKKGMLIYLSSIVFIGVIYGIIFTGFFGFVNRIPDKEEIKSVSISYRSNIYYSNDYNMRNVSSDEYSEKPIPTFEDEETINKTLDLHSHIVECLPQNRLYYINENLYLPGVFYGEGILIRYTLNNGKTLERFYPLYTDDYYLFEPTIDSGYNTIFNADFDEFNVMNKKIKSIIDTPEYIFKSTGLHLLPNTSVKKIVVSRFSKKGYKQKSLKLLNKSFSQTQCDVLLNTLRESATNNKTLIRKPLRKYKKNGKVFYRIRIRYKDNNSVNYPVYYETYYFAGDEYPELLKIIKPLVE